MNKSPKLLNWHRIEPFIVSASKGSSAFRMIEDMRNGIMPYATNHDIVTATPDNKSKELILRLISHDPLSHIVLSSFSDNILEFLDDAASSLAQTGIYVCQIESIGKDNGTSNLRRLYPSVIVVNPFMCTIKSSTGKGTQTNRYSPEDLWIVELPSILGGSRRYISLLRWLNKHIPISPKFVDNMLADSVQKGQLINDMIYDHAKYRSISNKVVIQSTRHIGWNRRDTSIRFSTEFYVVYKYVKLRYTQSIIREHLLNEFNALLTRLGVDSQISIPGIQDSKEIKELLQNLLRDPHCYKSVLDLVPIGGLT